MKKILVVVVGGTIFTTLKNGVRILDIGKAKLLEENFKDSKSVHASNAKFDYWKGVPPYNTCSENMSIRVWNQMKKDLENIIIKDSNKYDGVIITHGTDTLAYSAAMFSILFAGVEVPVIFVASNAPLEDEKSNGYANFRAAVECICEDISPNIYVTYKNLKDDSMYIHLGTHIEQCRNYDEDFYSRDKIEINAIEQIRAISFGPFSVIDKYNKLIYGKKLHSCILKIDPYVGLDYRNYKLNNIKAVLHGTYHSGTVCAETSRNKSKTSSIEKMDSIKRLISACQKWNIPIYKFPSKQVDSSSGIYESDLTVQDKTLQCYGMTAETIYAKLTIAYSIFAEDIELLSQFISDNINGEYFL